MTPDELADIRQDATFTAERAGAPGSPVRLRAEATLRLLDAYEAMAQLICEMWACAKDWSGPDASSHYRSDILDRIVGLCGDRGSCAARSGVSSRSGSRTDRR
jgi:hypothetical protein